MTEKFQYQGGRTRESGSQGDVYKTKVIMTIVPRRKIYLAVIDQWLQKKRPVDEYVIEALSKYLSV